MICNLKNASLNCVELETQVCIIGAGTAGIFLAQQLLKSGVRVVLLEAGDQYSSSPESLNQYCIQKGIRYRGADNGRSFGLGGTSVLWGGQLIPLKKSDTSARPEVGFEQWPIQFSEIEKYYSKVKQKLGLQIDSENQCSDNLNKYYPLLSKVCDDFELRLSSWLPFKTRNFSKKYSGELHSNSDLEVWLNSIVTGFTYSSHEGYKKITSVKAKSIKGNTLVVRSDCVVICAGALESTRMMLDLDEASDGSITKQGAPLGRYFSDHLSVTCGRFYDIDLNKYNMAVAPIFTSGVMHTPRLELSSLAQKRFSTTSAFAHFTFVTHGDTGFDVVRNILRKRQGENRTINISPKLVLNVITDIASMVYWRYINRRLWFPKSAELLLQVDIEQVANFHSRLYLSNERDEFDRRRLVIDWKITEDDIRVIKAISECTLKIWTQSPLNDIAHLDISLPDKIDDFNTLYDVYHPTGTLRMGKSPNNSIVDSNLKLWAFDNCFISSTAVFPSAGSANPGLTHLALTYRLGEYLRRVL